MASVVDLYLVYKFIKRLSTPFEEWDAYKEGVIDEKGNILKSSRERKTVDERNSFDKFDLLVLKMKKLIEKAPGGDRKLASYAAALWLIKEHQENGTEVITEESFAEYLDLAENMSVGSGAVDGIGYGEKGEPGFRKKDMNSYKRKNQKDARAKLYRRWTEAAKRS